MNDKIKLSNRLKTITTFLPKGAYFADIGTDHAFLPCFVCLKDSSARAIAGEVSNGPYETAERNIERFNLLDKIDIRLGDGLEVIREDPVRQIVISGMGGALITNILETGKNNLETVERIITQPNIGEKNIRKWFFENGYIITEEMIISEKDHLYEIIVADKNKCEDLIEKDTKELLFGPILLKNKSDLFYTKWRNQHEKNEYILKNLKHAKYKDDQKITELTNKISLIEEVLLDE